jgi:hypothetical protein
VFAFESLLPKKSESSVRVAFICGSGDPGVKDGDPVLKQRSNDLGRFTRAMPMFLAEELKIQTLARSSFVLPWIKGGGFVLSAKPWRYQDLKIDRTKADYVALLHVDARQTSWTMRLELIVATDGAAIGMWDQPIDLQRLQSTAAGALENVIKAVGVVRQSPESDELMAPPPERLAQYLVALEQALAVGAANVEDPGNSILYEERSIFDNLLSLAVDTPACIRTRCLLLNTLEKEARRRPDIAREYREKIQRLQKEHPLKAGPASNLVAAAIATLETKTSGQ